MQPIVSASYYSEPSGSAGGVIDRNIILRGSAYARKMGIGTDWKKLRIGMLVALGNDPGSTVTQPSHFWGLCSSTGSIYGETNPGHAVGFCWSNNTWTRNAGPPVYFTPGNTSALRWIRSISGSGETTAGIAGTINMSLPATASVRSCFSFGLTKILSETGSIIVLDDFFHRAGLGTPITHDVSEEVFVQQMTQHTQSLSQHLRDNLAGSHTIVTDESSGSLDSVCVMWGNTHFSFEIYALAVTRLE